MIQEVRVAGIPPGVFSQTPYQISYQVLDPSQFEVEPNNAVSSSTSIKQGTTMNGTLASNDVDWYCAPAGVSINTVQVTGMPGIDILLKLRLGPSAEYIRVDNGRVGAGEGATLPKKPGPTCASIERKIRADAGPADGKSGSYQILFQ